VLRAVFLIFSFDPHLFFLNVPMQPPALTGQWVEQQANYKRAQIEVAASKFWSEMASVQLSQQQAGTGRRIQQRPTHRPADAAAIYLSAAVGRLRDMMAVVGPGLRLGPSRMMLLDWLALEKRRSHCSSMIKVTEEGELLHVHNPWWSRDSRCSVWSTLVPLSLLALRHATGLFCRLDD
jgi:hypothetical protein